MDAVEFLEEQYRMCEALRPHCGECGLTYTKNKTDLICTDFIKRHPEEAVAIVEKWAKEHPRKTRQSELLKLFPSASKQGDGILTFCPRAVDTEFLCPRKDSDDYSECVDCRRDFWLAEVDE